MRPVETTLERAASRTLAGHPRGLFYLAFTEAWERFSFYGMMGLLALYMVDQLLLPEHAVHVAALRICARGSKQIFGPLSTQAFASQIFWPLYGASVLHAPVRRIDRGSLDRATQRGCARGFQHERRPHRMAFDRSFLIALLLLIVGSGLLKGNIAAQVGGLYPPEDETRRTHGYVLFSTGLMSARSSASALRALGAVLRLALRLWHRGALHVDWACYVLHGYRYLPARVERSTHPDRR